MTKRQPMKAYVVYQNKAQLEWAGCHFTRQSAKEAVGDWMTLEEYESMPELHDRWKFLQKRGVRLVQVMIHFPEEK